LMVAAFSPDESGVTGSNETEKWEVWCIYQPIRKPKNRSSCKTLTAETAWLPSPSKYYSRHMLIDERLLGLT
jgi:hypothetical protein